MHIEDDVLFNTHHRESKRTRDLFALDLRQRYVTHFFFVCAPCLLTQTRCSGGSRLGAFGGLIVLFASLLFTHTTLEPTEGKHLSGDVNENLRTKLQYFIVAICFPPQCVIYLYHTKLTPANKKQRKALY
jgi:hypothetical protein